MSEVILRVIDTYVNLPILPIGIPIDIKKIGVYNWNPREGGPGELMKYSMFSKLKPLEYPEAINQDKDYTPEDRVAPVIIADTQGAVYRTSHELWGILANIHDGILIKQDLTGKKLLPKTLFIDRKKLWVCELMNLVGGDILQKLSDYRDVLQWWLLY